MSRPTYQVALSFAGEQRQYVEEVARNLRARGVSLFYDGFERSYLWGKDGAEAFYDVFSQRAAYVVMFISKAYVSKLWPRHERRAAFAQMIQAHREYVLPVRFDDTPVPGLPDSTIYERAEDHTPAQLAMFIAQKLGKGLQMSRKSNRKTPKGKPKVAPISLGLTALNSFVKKFELWKRVVAPSLAVITASMVLSMPLRNQEAPSFPGGQGQQQSGPGNQPSEDHPSPSPRIPGRVQSCSPVSQDLVDNLSGNINNVKNDPALLALLYNELSARIQPCNLSQSNEYGKESVREWAKATNFPGKKLISSNNGIELTPEFFSYIQKYQQSKNLKVTGKLDYDTLQTAAGKEINLFLYGIYPDPSAASTP